MIFSLPFWVSSIAINIIKSIFSGAVDAIFAIYARRSHDLYANSIQWSRIGDLLETVPLLWNSRRQVPKQSSIAMATMIFIGLCNMVVTIFLGAAVFHADTLVDLGSTVVFTTQLVSGDASFRLDWTAFMESVATVEDTLVLLLNDTRSHPYPSPQTVYEPLTYVYDVVCQETAAALAQDFSNFTFSIRPLRMPGRLRGPQPWNPIILADIKQGSPLSADKDTPVSQPEPSIRHMPLGTQDSLWTFSTAHLIKATTDATGYLASLGHNIVTNKEAGQLYILHDTFEFEDAFKVPTALLIVLGVVVVACLGI
ncbi:hypothetical protein BGZ47_005488 [Haplosporangium gracile]|nr:hypothetical protein BGZ47_005488 [Haplosporangium gracile]